VSAATEAQRQQALLATLWQPVDDAALPLLQQSGARAAQGLAAYRANAAALAERALAAVFATVQAMLGADHFKHLAREYWHARPPERGDMGEWGGDFPDWLQGHTAFDEWPYLGDSARLDLAVHRCERAADAEFDAASLGLLQDVDPAQLRIALMPGTAVLGSAWPLATIHRAHRQLEGQQDSPQDAAAAEDGFADVRAALQARRGEAVVVVRSGWKAQVHDVDAPTLAWTRLLLDGAPVGAALEQAGEGFDVSAWLAWALREGAVKEVLRVAD
jgi:Putative DNA-binding domain